MITPQFINVSGESYLLDNLKPNGDDADYINIQTLDSYGYTKDSYLWIDGVWCDDNEVPVANVTFAPGQGLWVFGTGDGQSIRFPAPEL